VTLQEGYFWTAERGSFGKFASPMDSLEQLIDSASARPDLSIVVSDGHDYVQFAYYASPPWTRRLFAVADPDRAFLYTGSDSLDKQMFALQCCLALQVYDFRTFALANSTFLLYSGGGNFDWWPLRLLHDGYSLQLLAAEGNHRLYFADLAGKSR
jgi:hypothetical protein